MFARSRLFLLVGLSLLATRPGHGEPPAAGAGKASDRGRGARADFLPAGALVRLGDARFRAGGGAVQALAFSPDGKTLISVDGYYEPGAARFWDVATGRQVREVPMSASKGGQHALLSADHRLVAWEAESAVRPPSDDDKPRPPESVNVVDVWDLKSGRRLHRLQVPGRWPHSFSFAPGGKMLASRHTGGMIVLWDCATGRKVKQLRAPVADKLEQGSRGSVAWSPTGKLLAAAQENGRRFDYTTPPAGTTVRFWTLPGGKRLDRTVAFEDVCLGLNFSPDGKRLAVRGDRALLIAETATGKGLRKLSLRRPRVAFSADGKLLAATDSRHSGGGDAYEQWDDVWLVDLSGGAKPRRLPVKPHRITALTFSPDGKTLATGGYGSEIRLWDVPTGKEKTPGRATPLGSCIAFGGDGKTVAAADGAGAIGLWDARTGRQLGVLPGKSEYLYLLRFSADGRLLASVDDGHGLRVWDVARRKLLWPEGGERWRGALSAAFSPDGGTLAVCFGLNYNREKTDKDIRLCEARSGKEIRRLKAEVDTVAFSPDGKVLAGGCQTDGSGARHDSGVRLWDVAGGKLLRAYDELHKFESWNAESLTFSPEGRTLVVWHRRRFRHDHQLVGLELASGKTRWEIDVTYHASTMTGTRVAVTPDGRVAAVANGDRTVGLYRLDTAEKLGELAGHRGAVVDVAFAPDGKRLASVSWDKTALIWDTSTALEKVRNRPARLSEQELGSAWDALAGSDARAAHRAVWRLVGAGDGATTLLKDRLPRSSHRLQQIRGVEVLERLDSAEARTLLKALAEGAPEARLTREAKASLRRLRR
jgi:WD40 repeat protein